MMMRKKRLIYISILEFYKMLVTELCPASEFW